MNSRLVLPACVWMIGWMAAAAAAQEQYAADQIPLETKRQTVRTEMVREFADSLDAARLAEIDRRVAGMSAARVEQLFEIYQKRAQANSHEARLQEAQQQAYRDARVLEYQQRLAAARSGVGGAPGYAPVITTLPSGTHLGASAVVSPDRRYVRMSLQPFFSNVGPVQTFTFQNPTPFGQHPPMRPPLRAR